MSEVGSENEVAPSGDIARLTEHLFRRESGKLISVLTGLFGSERLQLAEDVVQEALIRALKTWPYYGVPQNPAAWLTQTAKNLALDIVRREKVFRGKQPALIATLEQWPSESEGQVAAFESEIADDRLRLMFTCCHPAIPQDAQIALALRTLCGFGVGEIAKAFLTSEAAIEKRLVRARQRIRELRIPFEIPAGEALAERLDSVLHTLYLLFNEGYKASEGESLVKEALCEESVRLAALLAAHPAGNHPRTHALLALFLFNAARLSARTDDDGNILRLKEQDRSRWDRNMIAKALSHLQQSAAGDLTAYHLQAGIAACHALAPDYNATDWNRILSLYDQLQQVEPSPIVALNRAVAVAELHGAEAGLSALKQLEKDGSLADYHLLHAVRGEFELRAGKFVAAAKSLRRALELSSLNSERAFLEKLMKQAEIQSQGSKQSGA
ncbi:MAG TPA: sigma-70 family RNA polymerase sigma factor [Methylomirabilota bacterium]|nr:sigma-70 family RNA polymerase sigma factor [Methylomirabilota bacterium]